MREPNPFIKSIRDSAGVRLAVLFSTFFIFLLLSSIISMGIDSLPIGDKRTHSLWGSVVSCLLVFCIPAIILSRFSSHNWESWLYLKNPPKLKALIGVVLIYIVSMPAMEWLIQWNNNLHFPASMSSIEDLFRGWEENSANTTRLLLEVSGFFPVLFGVLVIGVLTGFSEELFFRGGVQGIFTRSEMGRTMAVWLTAILFSVMHFQFFGFLPRLLMGAFFGYLLIWTQSIWVPVFAHVLNNSVVVVTASLTGVSSEDMFSEGIEFLNIGNNVVVLFSLVLTAIFLIFFRREFFKTDRKWQRNQLPPVIGR